MKVVADTMMWVSYCTAKCGFRHRLIDAACAKKVRLFCSDYILTELANTLAVDFDFSNRALKLALETVCRQSICLRLRIPRGGWVTADPGDDPIVHTSLLAKADYLVTGDRALLEIAQVEDVRIISIGAFAELVGYTGRNGSN